MDMYMLHLFVIIFCIQQKDCMLMMKRIKLFLIQVKYSYKYQIKCYSFVQFYEHNISNVKLYARHYIYEI